MKKIARISVVALALAAVLSPIVLTAQQPASAATAAATTTTSSATMELSGASGNGVTTGLFGTWRGAPVDISGTWSDDDANSVNFWQLQTGGAYAGWNQPLDIAVGAIDAGETWQAAAAGAYDARWTTSLTKLKALRANTTATTYIRFAHEMNGNWYPWAVNSSNYTYFDAAWKRYRALQEKIFPAAKLVFSLNRESVGTGMDWRKFFPGKQYVDVIGVDYYNQYPYVSTQADWTASLSNTDQWGAPKGLDTYLAYAKSVGLPLSIPEWSGDNQYGDSPTFVTDMLTYFKAHAGTGAGQIAYDILFNVGGYNKNFQLYGPDAAMPKSSAAYKAFFTKSTATTTPPAAGSSSQTVPVTKTTALLNAKSTLAIAGTLVSTNGAYTFRFNTDGNLVVLSAAGKAIWNAGTRARGGTRLVMQADGNLVLYTAAGKAVWTTKTNGKGSGAHLDVQSDGNLVLYSAAGRALWASK